MKLLNLFIALIFSLGLFAQNQTMGLFLNDEQSFNGYTLFSNNQTSYLIDNCGLNVHTWTSQYNSNLGIYLLENGDLLRAGAVNGSFNGGGTGGAFQLFDWDGNLKWEYIIADNFRHAHHDLEPLPNGNFLCVVWELITTADAQAVGRTFNGNVWSERIIEIEMLPDNQANFVWEWSAWDHLVQDDDPNKPNFGIVSDHPELINVNYIGPGEQNSGDWLHVNSIDYNETLDQVSFSSRHFNEVFVIDHSTSTEEAASHTGGTYGKGGDILFRFGNPAAYDQGDEGDGLLGKQHNFEWILDENGWPYAFTVYNNQYVQNIQSAVHIFENPIDENGFYDFTQGFENAEIIRTYTSPNLFSSNLSSAQLLPNGNLFILEGRDGFMREVNAEDNVVWEYINPVRRNGGPATQGTPINNNSLFRARRYGTDYEGFEGKDLTPGLPIELSPIDSDCGIFTSVDFIGSHADSNIELIGNPIIDILTLECTGNIKDKVLLVSCTGVLIKELELLPGVNRFDLPDLLTGLYFIKTRGSTIKVIKS